VSFLDSGSRFNKASRGRIGAELVRLDDVETSEQLLVLDSLERSKSSEIFARDGSGILVSHPSLRWWHSMILAASLHVYLFLST
jgi:hypothetical protein